MNTRVLTLFIVLISLLLAGCNSTLTRNEVKVLESSALGTSGDPLKVQLKVQKNPTRLTITSGKGKNCKGEGCINSPVNTSVKANFRLNGSSDWHFSRFEICLGTDKGDRKCQLGIFDRLEYAAFVDSDDKIALPDENGIINLAELGQGNDLEEFRVANQNSVKQNYYYRVQVCPDAGDEPCIWNEDPKWPNKGRGR